MQEVSGPVHALTVLKDLQSGSGLKGLVLQIELMIKSRSAQVLPYQLDQTLGWDSMAGA